MRRPARALLSLRVVVLAVFCVVVGAVYLSSPVFQSADGRLVVYEAHSIIHEGNTDLHEFGSITDGFPCYRVENRIISRYPYGTALMTTPLLLAAEQGGRVVGQNPTRDINDLKPWELEKALASIIAVLGCLAIVLLALEMTGRLAPSLVVGVLFAFGTAFWSTISRGLWQHGPLVLLVTTALILLVRGSARQDWRLLAFSGVPLAAGFIVRPTAATPIALVGLYLLYLNRRAALAYGVAVAAVLLPSIAYNEYIYGAVLNPFYFDNGDSFVGGGIRDTFLTGLAGTMVSPARGMLVFAPFLILAFVALRWPRRRIRGLEVVAVVVILAQWVVTSNTLDWPGGYSYGPRLLSDLLPWFALLMIPLVDAVVRPRGGRPAFAPYVLGFLLAAGLWSGFVNGTGAMSWSAQAWNVKPVPASYATTPDRFWDWDDPMFLRRDGTRRQDMAPNQGPPAIPAGQQCVMG